MTKTRDLSDFLIEGGADLPLGKPHIVPGVLYPAVGGKDINGTALSSYTYGDLHAGTGVRYYYTDIKGSKPIKDPRIGAHFGSQRHKFKSLQLLEQETATHGNDVFSIDGREWIRGVGGANASVKPYDDSGHRIRVYGFVEIVGYFIDVNLIIGCHTNDREFNTSVDGGSASSANTLFQTSSVSPLGSRHVDSGSVGNLGLGLSLGIHTLKVTPQAQSENIEFFGVELIAQDTTSTANRSKIQIPSQNVVSFGKKFPISATAVHYDPFTTMSYGGSGTTLSALGSLIDTDTSLGMDAWKAGTSNYHRPWNGGRVIKWVDSSGAIKTSVNMMPPNAQNIGTTASNAVSDAHVIAGTNDDTINFNTSAVDHAQSEVAKTFHWREFGNGSANGGTGSGSYADASMLSVNNGQGSETGDNIAYVMDDGLSSINASNVIRSPGGTNNIHDRLLPRADGAYWYITFIGTGFSYHSNNAYFHVAQNLPYGTHVIKCYRDNNDSADITVDGVSLLDVANSNYALIRDFITFHQPKRPPIPEDAVVLADYMLMADFVPQTSPGATYISKGTRRQNVSRDVLVNHLDGTTLALEHTAGGNDTSFGYYLNQNGTASSELRFKVRIPSFGTNYVLRSYQSEARSRLFIDDTDKDSSAIKNNNTVYDSFAHLTSSLDLGVYNFGANAEQSTNLTMSGFDVATPIHTSSHYQSFETPFLHELVGGDRNMEQTNLVCSPDGKTWDELTRDTSYLGNQALSLSRDGGDLASGSQYVWDYTRGEVSHGRTYFTKDWIIGYDRIICLKDGQYSVDFTVFSNADNNRATMFIFYNGSSDALVGAKSSTSSGEKTQGSGRISRYFNRGDYLKFTYYSNTAYGSSANSANSALLQINKV